MKAWTGIEILEALERLEHDSALNIGRILFEFSRLDLDLGLCIVWANEGRQLDVLTKKISGPDFSFHRKLDLLEKLATKTFLNKEKVLSRYQEWIVQANLVRQTRNNLVHGRWGIDVQKNCVVNVIGFPTSPERYTESYTIKELESQLDQILKLRHSLGELRKSNPV
jgi:hypothetical protein